MFYFVSSFRAQFVRICIATCEIIIIVLFCLVFSIFIDSCIWKLYLDCAAKATNFDLLISVPKEKKASFEVKSVLSLLELTLIFVWNTIGVRIYPVLQTKFYKFKECLKIMNQRHNTNVVMRTSWSRNPQSRLRSNPEKMKRSDMSVTQWKLAPRHQNYWNEAKWCHEAS